jgi:hypothetical protein
MTFKKVDKNQDLIGDALQCAVAGCTNRWSVQLDGRPKCSFHQWYGSKPIEYGSMSLSIGNHMNDNKGWAKRILDRHNNGFQMSQLSVKFAKQALKIFD